MNDSGILVVAFSCVDVRSAVDSMLVWKRAGRPLFCCDLRITVLAAQVVFDFVFLIVIDGESKSK